MSIPKIALFSPDPQLIEKLTMPWPRYQEKSATEAAEISYDKKNIYPPTTTTTLYYKLVMK